MTTEKKQWAVGDRCYVLTPHDGVRRGRVDVLYVHDDVKVRMDAGFAYWTSTKSLRVSRDALDVAHLTKRLVAAKEKARVAAKESLAADKRERLALSAVAALEEKLAAAKAKVTK